MENLAYEISTGLLIAFLVSALTWVFPRALWPLVRSLRHSAPNINNTVWDGYSREPSNGEQPNSRMTIKQWGDVVTARTERNTSNGVRRFRYKGRIRANQVVLNWEEPRGGGVILGSMVMRLSANRQRLDGYSVYVRLDGGDVYPEPRFYVRKSDA